VGAHSSGLYSVTNPIPEATYEWEILDSNNDLVDAGSGTAITVLGAVLGGPGTYKIRVRATSPCGTYSAWKQNNLFVVNC
jgi:hypothetical protein